MNITLTQSLLGPELGPKFLNTTYIDTLLPGMIAKFGKDQPVEINFAANQAPTSQFKPAQMTVDVTAELTVTVNGQLACIIDVISAQTVVSATLKDFLLKI